MSPDRAADPYDAVGLRLLGLQSRAAATLGDAETVLVANEQGSPVRWTGGPLLGLCERGLQKAQVQARGQCVGTPNTINSRCDVEISQIGQLSQRCNVDVAFCRHVSRELA